VKLGTDCSLVRDPVLQYVSSVASIELCMTDESSYYLQSSWLSLVSKVEYSRVNRLLTVELFH